MNFHELLIQNSGFRHFLQIYFNFEVIDVNAKRFGKYDCEIHSNGVLLISPGELFPV